jgi:uncharacterized membrane protein
MAENPVESNRAVSSLTIAVVFIVVVAAVIGAVTTLIDPNFVYALLPGGTTYAIGGSIYQIVYVVLTLTTDVLYLFGGGVIAFGAILVIIRFLQRKLRDPYQPSLSTRYLAGYLTLGLEIFIGAEIIRTVVVGASEIELLILVIASRGLFSLILYLERRWHGTAETE